MDIKKLKIDFQNQRSSAKRRKIEFNLTFEEWLNWWCESGHLHERGPRREQYCMARYNDSGPYALGNIKCVTTNDNRIEGLTGNKNRQSHAPWNKGTKGVCKANKASFVRGQTAWNKGRKHTDQHRAALCEAWKKRKVRLEEQNK